MVEEQKLPEQPSLFSLKLNIMQHTDNEAPAVYVHEDQLNPSKYSIAGQVQTNQSLE